jgi:hypothetical protein
MTQEELKNSIDELKSIIEDVQNKIQSLENSSTIGRDIETALRERLQISQYPTSTGITGSATTQSISIASTPTNITVPSQPSGTIPIVVNGTTYNLLYK